MTESGAGARGLTRVADSAGVLGAAFAALCCAGTPFIVAGLAAIGLGFLRKDAILWPVMILSLAVALWGFWRGWRMHERIGPLLVALPSAIALVAGVIFVHGFPAREMIWAAIVGLIAATAWNIAARRRRSPNRNVGAP